MDSLFDTEIIALNSTGQGIGSLNGLIVFIDQALPGEQVSAKLTLQKKRFAQADLIEIQKKSEDRIEPTCPIFHLCGGCQIMHLKEEKRLEYKTTRVKDALVRIGKIDQISPLPCIASPAPLYYRNKTQFSFFEKEGKVSLGLYQKHTNDIVEVKTCYIQSSLGQKIYSTLCELIEDLPLRVFNPAVSKGFLRHLLIRTTDHTQECLIVFITHSNKHKDLLSKLATTLMQIHPEVKGVLQNINKKSFNSIAGDTYHTLKGRPFLFEEVKGLKIKISAHAFFQVNTVQAANLYQIALDFADLNPNHIVLDAYCGIGMFALFAASHVKKVIGIESVPIAIADAKENAQLNSIKNVEFQCAHVEKVITQLDPIDVAFINPPRKGCDLKVLEAFSKLGIKKVIYVSCDPATLARDLAYLLKQGFNLVKVQPLDMFPQTTHVESIALLVHSSLDSIQ